MTTEIVNPWNSGLDKLKAAYPPQTTAHQSSVASRYDHGADMIVTPCPLCRTNADIYQKDVNERYGTKFNMPVTH